MSLHDSPGNSDHAPEIDPAIVARFSDRVRARVDHLSVLTRVAAHPAVKFTSDIPEHSISFIKNTPVPSVPSLSIPPDQTLLDEIAEDQGKEIAGVRDQAILIQVLKAARFCETMANQADAPDPAKLYAALCQLLVKLGADNDDVMIVVRHECYNTLVDDQYVTDGGLKGRRVPVVPVRASNNLPNCNVTGHCLSNTSNSNAYDGDFSNVVAAMFSPQSIMAGATSCIQSKVFFDKRYNGWFAQSVLTFDIKPDRAKHTGKIVLA